MKIAVVVELEVLPDGSIGWKATVPEVPTIKEAYGVHLSNVLTSIAYDIVEHTGGAAQ